MPVETLTRETWENDRMLGPEPCVHETARVHDSRLGAWTEIGPSTHISETTLDDYSYVTLGSQVIYADIGKFCSIAAFTRINPGNHPLPRAALHHFTYRSRKFQMGDDDESFFNWRREHRVRLGHDVWIGHGAIILPGVTIGTGAVVGAGAVVSKDVAPFTATAGVPARPIRERFREDDIFGVWFRESKGMTFAKRPGLFYLNNEPQMSSP